MSDLNGLRTVVQRNCHLSDSRHARDYTMCVYLLKMREYFRWERGLPLTQPLPQGELGEWVVARERLWESLGQEEFQCLPVGPGCHEPFDADRVNDWLVPEGMVYSAGYGRFVKPHFFLARLLRHESRDGFDVYVSSHEYARDLSAPPAMLQGRSIFVRREALRLALWERVEEWRWHGCPDNAVGRAVACYPFATDPEAALARMTDDELEPVILHELGEGRAGEVLGEAWPRLLMSVAGSRAEMHLRAVRDLAADCLVALPAILERAPDASIHLFFAHFRGHRLHLFPRLLTAYREWLASGDRRGLRDAAETAGGHWIETARAALRASGQGDGPDPEALVGLVEGARLA